MVPFAGDIRSRTMPNVPALNSELTDDELNLVTAELGEEELGKVVGGVVGGQAVGGGPNTPRNNTPGYRTLAAWTWALSWY